MIQFIRTARIGTRQFGFTLIELAIVLGVAGVLFGGLWRLLSGGNQQLRDQSAATSQTQVINAVKNYLASYNGQNWMATKAPNAVFALPLPKVPPDGVSSSGISNYLCKTSAAPTYGGVEPQGICDYLPMGFEGPTGSNPTANSYGQTYAVEVLKDSSPTGTVPSTYSFMVVASGGTTISDTSGGRIAAAVGGDGGFIYSSSVCGATPAYACGSYGSWAVTTSTYGFTALTAPVGSIATRSYFSPEQNSNAQWLARTYLNGSTYYNTMQTDLYMGVGIGTAVATNIWMTPLGTTTGGGNINMQDGTINMSGGTLSMGSGEITAVGGGGITFSGTGPIAMGGGPLSGVGSLTLSSSSAYIGMDGGSLYMNSSGATTGGGSIDLNGGTLTGEKVAAGAVVTLTNDGTEAPSILATATCNYSAGSSCTKGAISIPTGDIIVSTGEVNAANLYAGQFIYGQNLTSSDARLKTNIQPLQHGLDDIEKLKPVSYRLKSTGKTSLGVVAQDLEKVYPELVFDDHDGYKAVAYQGLIAPLISAVQELKEENDDLRQQLQQQALRQQKLENLLKDKQTP